MDGNFECLQILKDNKSDVTSCDFGGNYLLAVGSSDKIVRVLEWKTGLGFVDVSYSPLQSHKYGVTWVRFSPQGTMLASSSLDGTTILWNVKTGNKIHIMVQATKCSVRRCEFTPDSTTLITAGDDGFFCFWDLVHKTHISKHFLHNDEDSCIQGLAISPDSEYVSTGDSNGVIKLWSISEIKQNQLQSKPISTNEHEGLTSCEFSPCSDITGSGAFKYKYSFATCGSDGLIKVWKIEVVRKSKPSTSADLINCEMTVTNVLSGHENDVLNIRFNTNGSLIASTGLDKSVKLWEVQTGKCIKHFVAHTRYVNCCAFSKNSAFLASGSNDKTVVIWDLNQNCSLDSELIKKCSRCSHFTGDWPVRVLAEEIVIHNSENDVIGLQLLQSLQMSAGINTVHFHDSNLLATAGGNKTVMLWRRKTKDSPFILDDVLKGHKYSVNQIEISRCGTKLISSSMNGIIIVWDLQTGLTYEMIIPNCINSVRTNRFSPNSEFIAAGGDDQKVCLWNVRSLEFIKVLQEHKDAITSVAFTSDSKFLASTCCAGDLKLYDLEADVCCVSKDSIHDLGAMSCDFSIKVTRIGLDCEYVLATSGNDSLIKTWKIRANQITGWKELANHRGNVNYVRFSPKVDHLLVSCATDCTARLWNVNSGDCLHVFYHHESIVTTCAFSLDSNLLATGSLDKSTVIWTLPPENYFDKTNFTHNCKKLMQHWCTSDIVEWLSDLGFEEVSHKVRHTSLNGQQLLGLKINDILDLIGIVGNERKTIGLQLYWARNEAKRISGPHRQQDNAPHQFLCPITHEIMSDPVICSDGFTYERGAIIEWLLCGKYTSPMTNEPLRDLKFLPNTTLRTDICRFIYGEDIKD